MPPQNSISQKPTLQESSEVTINLFPVIVAVLLIIAGVAGFLFYQSGRPSKIQEPATTTLLTFTVNGKKEVIVPQGTPVVLAWDVQGPDPNDPTPCEATADAITSLLDGELRHLSTDFYTWIGAQPSSGSAEVLAYSDPNYQKELIFMLTCQTTGGEKKFSVSVKNIIVDSGDMKAALLANGADVATISVAGLGSLDLSWTVSGASDPTVCNISDIGNVIIAKNLPTSGSYSIQSPKVGQQYYVNCTDAKGKYAFGGVELVE